MKQNTTVIVGVAVLTIVIASFMMIMTNNNKSNTVIVVSNSDTTTYKLDNLRVTYKLTDSDKKLYDIKVFGFTKSDTEGGGINSVRISGKACNNQNGNFEIIDENEVVDKPVLVKLNDGRQVLDSPVVSTMMACLDVADPKYDDAALTEAITNTAKSLQSY